MNQEKIGKFISKLRNEKNMTQRELGEILGVSYKAISKWERGINLPDASLYNEICKTFGITKDELFAGKRIKIKVKKFLIFTIILILFFIFLIYITTPKFYRLRIYNDNMFYFRNTGGILVNGFNKDAFQLTLSLNNPDKVCTIGLFVFKNDELQLLESYGSIPDNDAKCMGIRSEDGYANTTETFTRIERYFQNGNIISKMIKNQNNTYLCVSDKILEELTLDDCYKITFEKVE